VFNPTADSGTTCCSRSHRRRCACLSRSVSGSTSLLVCVCLMCLLVYVCLYVSACHPVPPSFRVSFPLGPAPLAPAACPAPLLTHVTSPVTPLIFLPLLRLLSASRARQHRHPTTPYSNQSCRRTRTPTNTACFRWSASISLSVASKCKVPPVLACVISHSWWAV
jgi:hypothetical protein